MNNSGKSAKPRGKPFAGKDDPRNWKNGPVCKDMVTARAEFMKELASTAIKRKSFKKIADKVLERAEAGHSFSVGLIFEYFAEKPPQQSNITGEVKVPIRLIYENADTDARKS